jgi:hypothetical protein
MKGPHIFPQYLWEGIQGPEPEIQGNTQTLIPTKVRLEGALEWLRVLKLRVLEEPAVRGKGMNEREKQCFDTQANQACLRKAVNMGEDSVPATEGNNPEENE